MKRKLLVLLITAASTMMPNLASAVATDLGADPFGPNCCRICFWC
jgi:hypothetical protein